MRRSDSAFWEWNSVYNKNTSWVDHPAVWVVYLAFILTARGLLVWVGAIGRRCIANRVLQFPVTNGTAWTIVHLAHAVVRYLVPCART